MALEWEQALGLVSAVSQRGSACRVSNLWYSEIGSVEADGNATTACPSLGSPVQVLQPAPRLHRVIGVKVFGILPWIIPWLWHLNSLLSTVKSQAPFYSP